VTKIQKDLSNPRNNYSASNAKFYHVAALQPNRTDRQKNFNSLGAEARGGFEPIEDVVRGHKASFISNFLLAHPN
jgi:hypothetical protein